MHSRSGRDGAEQIEILAQTGAVAAVMEQQGEVLDQEAGAEVLQDGGWAQLMT